MAKNIQHIILFASCKIKTGPEKTRDAGKESALGNKARKKKQFPLFAKRIHNSLSQLYEREGGESGEWRPHQGLAIIYTMQFAHFHLWPTPRPSFIMQKPFFALCAEN